ACLRYQCRADACATPSAPRTVSTPPDASASNAGPAVSSGSGSMTTSSARSPSSRRASPATPAPGISAGTEAAVDDEGRAVHERRPVGCEVDDRVGDLVRAAEPAHDLAVLHRPADDCGLVRVDQH